MSAEDGCRSSVRPELGWSREAWGIRCQCAGRTVRLFLGPGSRVRALDDAGRHFARTASARSGRAMSSTSLLDRIDEASRLG